MRVLILIGIILGSLGLTACQSSGTATPSLQHAQPTQQQADQAKFQKTMGSF